MPVSAFTSTAEIWDVMMRPNPFIHTTTTGGGALACAAAICSIQITLRERIWEQAAAKGDYLRPKLEEFAAHYPEIYERITGKGLLIGMHFRDAETGYKVAAGLFRRGIVVAGTLISAQTIRVEPPLIISYEQLDMFLSRLEDTLRDVCKAM